MYTSARFQRFLKDNHVKHEPTSGYTPQENGRAERTIASVKERLQCLLSDSGLRDRLWGEALLHAIYLHNISDSTGGVTPWEKIKGDKPDAAVLRIWGCKAWKLIPAEKRNKSADTRKSEQVRFLGFDWPIRKAYRVLTSRGTVETTRHLAFDESAPSACEKRADFSPFIETTIETTEHNETPVQSPQATPSDAPGPSQQEPLPSMSPIDDSLTGTVHETPALPMNVNPLFDDEQVTPPAIELETRRSHRDNIGKKPVRFNPCAYHKYAKGLLRVHFADPVAA